MPKLPRFSNNASVSTQLGTPGQITGMGQIPSGYDELNQGLQQASRTALGVASMSIQESSKRKKELEQIQTLQDNLDANTYLTGQKSKFDKEFYSQDFSKVDPIDIKTQYTNAIQGMVAEASNRFRYKAPALAFQEQQQTAMVNAGLNKVHGIIVGVKTEQSKTQITQYVNETNRALSTNPDPYSENNQITVPSLVTETDAIIDAQVSATGMSAEYGEILKRGMRSEYAYSDFTARINADYMAAQEQLEHSIDNKGLYAEFLTPDQIRGLAAQIESKRREEENKVSSMGRTVALSAVSDAQMAFKVALLGAEDYRNPYKPLGSATPNISKHVAAIERPKGIITSNFGKRTDPLTGEPDRHHNGVDISAKGGTPITSPVYGRITKMVQSGGGGAGSNITIQSVQDPNLRFIYFHLKPDGFQAKVGDIVDPGVTVALSGNTGRSTGPHIHHEVHYKGKAIDPIKFYADPSKYTSSLQSERVTFESAQVTNYYNSLYSASNAKTAGEKHIEAMTGVKDLFLQESIALGKRKAGEIISASPTLKVAKQRIDSEMSKLAPQSGDPISQAGLLAFQKEATTAFNASVIEFQKDPVAYTKNAHPETQDNNSLLIAKLKEEGVPDSKIRLKTQEEYKYIAETLDDPTVPSKDKAAMIANLAAPAEQQGNPMLFTRGLADVAKKMGGGNKNKILLMSPHITKAGLPKETANWYQYNDWRNSGELWSLYQDSHAGDKTASLSKLEDDIRSKFASRGGFYGGKLTNVKQLRDSVSEVDPVLGSMILDSAVLITVGKMINNPNASMESAMDMAGKVIADRYDFVNSSVRIPKASNIDSNSVNMALEQIAKDPFNEKFAGIIGPIASASNLKGITDLDTRRINETFKNNIDFVTNEAENGVYLTYIDPVSNNRYFMRDNKNNRIQLSYKELESNAHTTEVVKHTTASNKIWANHQLSVPVKYKDNVESIDFYVGALKKDPIKVLKYAGITVDNPKKAENRNYTLEQDEDNTGFYVWSPSSKVLTGIPVRYQDKIRLNGERLKNKSGIDIFISYEDMIRYSQNKQLIQDYMEAQR